MRTLFPLMYLDSINYFWNGLSIKTYFPILNLLECHLNVIVFQLYTSLVKLYL